MGKSGQGKTEGILSRIAQQMSRGGGLLFVDPKPTKETASAIFNLALSYGREQDFRLLDIYSPEKSHSVNFFLEGSADEATSTISAIFGSGASDNESAEHFKQQLLTAVSNRVGCIKKIGKAFNAMDLFILLTNPNAIQWLINNTPESQERMAITIEFDAYVNEKGNNREFDKRSLKSQVGGGANRLLTYGTGKLGQMMNTYSPQFNMHDAVYNNRLVYVPLPKLDMSEQSDAFARMLLSAVKIEVARAYREGAPLKPFLNIWDEFGSIAVPGTEELVEKMRGANFAGIFSFQTHANLIKVGEAFAARLIGNCEIRTFMALGDADSRNFASELIGELLKNFGSKSMGMGTSSANTNLDVELFNRIGKSTSEGEGSAERYDYAIRPEQLRDLPVGQAYVVPMAASRAFRVQFPMVKTPFNLPIELPVVTTPRVVGLNLTAMFNESFSTG